MNFKNAYKGLGNVITAEWLSILGTITGAGTVILALVGYAADVEKIEKLLDFSVGGFTVLALVTMALFILSFILNLVGLGKAGKDEVEFKKALLYIVVGFILLAVGAYFEEKISWLNIVTSIVSQLTNTFAMMHVVNGIAELADQMFNDKMIKKGKSVTVIILITFGIWLLGKLVVTFLFKDPKSNINVILTIAYLLMGIIQTFAYIIYLGKGRKMLRG